MLHTGWPAHAAGHVEMAYIDESYLFWHALLVAPIAVARRDLSPVTARNRELGNEDKRH